MQEPYNKVAFRTALGWGGLLNLVRLLLGLVSAKVSAVYLGPANMVLIGQLSSFISMLVGSIGNGPATAMVIFTSKWQDDKIVVSHLWGTAICLLLVISLIVTVFVVGFSLPLSLWLFGDEKYWLIVASIGVCIFLATADALLVGILNGLGQIKLISQAALTASLIGTTAFVVFAYNFGIMGGLIGILLIYVIRFPITLWLALRAGIVSIQSLAFRYHSGNVKEIISFYPMLLLHSISLPLSLIMIRNAVINDLGYEVAGFVQATWRLSDMYCGLLISVLGLYFIAHFTSQTTELEKKRTLWKTMFHMLSLSTGMAMSIYFLKDIIIAIVLTEEFLPMRELLLMQLSGDVLKMLGYPLQMALSAQRRVRSYMITAVAGPGLFVVFVYMLLPLMEVQAVPTAYFCAYGVLLLLLLFFHRKILFSRVRP